MKRSFFSLIVFAVLISACGPVTPYPIETPTSFPAPLPTKTPQSVFVSHPELEPITPDNVGRLELIDRWGRGHVYETAISSDGKILAVGTATGVYLYDSETLEPLPLDFVKTLNVEYTYTTIFEYPVRSLDFQLKDDRILAVANQWGVKFWNLDRDNIEGTITNHIPGFNINKIRFSPDGKTLLIVSGGIYGPCDGPGGNFALYSIETKNMLFDQYFCADPALYFSYSLSANGKAFFVDDVFETGDWAQRITIVDMNTGNVLKRYLFDDRKFHSVSPDGSLFVFDKYDTANMSVTTQFVDVNSLEEIASVDGRVTFISPSGKRLLFRDDNLEWQNSLGETICKFDARTDSSPFIFSADASKMIQWSSWTEILTVWDTTKCSISNTLSFFSGNINPEFSPDGRLLAVGSTYYAHLWDVKTGKHLFSLPGSRGVGPMHAFTFTQDGMALVAGTNDNPYVLKILDLQSGVEKRNWKAENNFINKIVTSPDGKGMAILDINGFSFLDISSGKLLYQSANYKTINLGDLSFSPDGSMLALVLNKGEQDEIDFIDVHTKTLVRKIPVDYRQIAFSPTWKYFAVTGGDGSIDIWDVDLAEKKLKLVGHHRLTDEYSFVGDLIFSPDDKMLVSMANKIIRFWDIESGRLIAELAPSFPVNHLTFSPDGHLIATTGSDGVIHIWGIPRYP